MSHQLFNQRFAIVIEYEEKHIIQRPSSSCPTCTCWASTSIATARASTPGSTAGSSSCWASSTWSGSTTEEGVEAYLRHKDEESQQNIEAKMRNTISICK